jgi:hypothetical protein
VSGKKKGMVVTASGFEDRLYYLGSAMAFGYGMIHIFQPNQLAVSWGIKVDGWGEETFDMMRLLGVWIIFQSFIASAIPLYITHHRVKRIFTIIHAMKNFAAFFVRLQMYWSGRYDPITTGFAFSLGADGMFAFAYSLCALFPNYFSTRNTKPF